MSATLSEAIGPKSAVTGRSTNDHAVTEVLESRLMPLGVEHRRGVEGVVAVRSATSGHSKNQANSEVSEHAHVVPRVIDSVRTFQSMPTASAA